MSDAKAHVALLIDFEGLAGGPAAAPAGTVAGGLLRYAGGAGRVTLARAYADWTAHPEDSAAVQGARVVPVHTPPAPGGASRTHVRLVVDAVEALYAGGEPDAFVLASSDSRLLPLVQALRADGCDVLFVAPAGADVADALAESDSTATLEEVLAGAVAPATTPRAAEDDEESPVAPPARGRGETFRAGPHRESTGFGPVRVEGVPTARASAWGSGHRGHTRPAPAPLDLANYDWSSFVKLIDELEHRLPFVGVRYLVNKVLGPRNCGIDEPRQKRDLINRAVDEGLLEMYEVGNVEDRRDPVTACRLDRRNAVVMGILGGETKTPVVPEAHEGAHDEGGVVEGGLSLDAADAGGNA